MLEYEMMGYNKIEYDISDVIMEGNYENFLNYIENEILNRSFYNNIMYKLTIYDTYEDYYYNKLKKMRINNETLLFICCRCMNEDVVHIAKFLIEECNLDPSKLNKNIDTPLHVAVKYDNFPIVEYLLDIGVEFISKNKDNEMPILLATENENFEIFKLLMEKICNDKGIVFDNKYTFFRKNIKYKIYSSIIDGSYSKKNKLFNITYHNKYINYDISKVCYLLFKKRNFEILEYIVIILNNYEEHLIKLKHIVYMRKTFNIILKEKNIKLYNLFIKIFKNNTISYKGKIQIKNINNNILHKLIFDIGEDSNIKEYWGYKIFKNYRKFDYKNKNGDTVLIIAAKNGNVNLCNYLIKLGYRIDTINYDGKTYIDYLNDFQKDKLNYKNCNFDTSKDFLYMDNGTLKRISRRRLKK